MADDTRAIFRISGPDAPQDEITVTTAGIQIGRVSSNDLALNHSQISRRHLRLYIEDDAVYVEDQNSSNGTRVNEERIEPDTPHRLNPGDNVGLGPFVLTLQQIITPEPETPEPEPEAPPEPEQMPEMPPADEPEPPQAEAPEPEPEPEPKPEPPAPRRARSQKKPEPPPEPAPAPQIERLEALEVPSLETRREAFLRAQRGDRQLSRVDGYDAQGYLHGVPRDKSTWLEYLPALYADDDFLGRYLLIAESLFMPLVWMVDNFDLYLSPEVAPAEWLQWMAGWFDLLLVPELPEARMRAVMDQAGWLFLRRGTRAGLERLLQLYFGVKPEIIEDKEPCRFTVRLPLSESSVKLNHELIERLIASQKPAFAAFTLEIT